MPVRRARPPRQPPRQLRSGNGITPDQIAELQAAVDHERKLEPRAELAAARRNALGLVLVNLVARWLMERGRGVNAWLLREVLDDPEIADVWRLYRTASEEADHDEDARDRNRSDCVLRFALRRGYSPLDAVRAARGDATLRKVDVENDADYQRARRSPPRARKPRSATRRGAFWEVMVVEAIRYELIRAGYTDH